MALVDLETRSEIGGRGDAEHSLGRMDPIRITTSRRSGPSFSTGWRRFEREHRIDAISVTTHGATAALVDANGDLALPVLDYEFAGPDGLRAAYEQVRPPFAETGTPRLPIGLNLGAQLFWQQKTFPDAFAKVSAILTYPQYWACSLTGVAASEVTSLGCHTDLWNPYRRDFSARWPMRWAGDNLFAAAAPRRRPARRRYFRTIAPASGSIPARRSLAASTIPTPRCCRIC